MKLIKSIRNVFSDKNKEVINCQDEAAVQKWLLERLAKHLKRNVSELDPNTSFEYYGLDSMFAVQITGELEKLLEMRLSPALLFENNNVNAVVGVISNLAFREIEVKKND